MSKLMYSESGGFATFPDHESPTGWVDGEPIRQKLLDAKRETATLPEDSKVGKAFDIDLPVEVTRIKIPSHALPPNPQDTPPRRPGRTPKITDEI